jgi:hypothetical protein
VAQIGACIGREFGYGLLEKVAGLPVAQLTEALERLTESELVFQKGSPPEASYTFKHALIQDAAYDGLLRSRRAQIHARIAQVLEEQFGEIAKAQPEIVAHHWTEARRPEKATPLWIAAGQQALNRFTLDEAIQHLKRGVAVACDGRAAGVDVESEIELRVLLGVAFNARLGWAADEVYSTFMGALDLMGPDAPVERLIPVLWGIWLNVLTQGRSIDSLQWVSKMFEVAEARHDEELTVVAHSAAQVSHFWSGSLVESKWHAEQVLARFHVERYQRLAVATHHNPRTTAGALLGQALWMLGYPDTAVALWRDTLEFAAEFSHPFDSCFAWAMGGYVVAYRRETDAVAEATATAYKISRDIGIPFMNLVVTPPVEAFGEFERGHYERVCRMLEQAATLWRGVRGRSNIPNWSCIWALSKAKLGDLKSAHHLVASGLEQIRTPGWGERTHLAELLRVKGELHLMDGDVDLALASFEESLTWAREQQSKSWELRTATSLARLMKSQGRTDEALAVLRPVYGWFTEGRDTKDHIEARQLLQELGG